MHYQKLSQLDQGVKISYDISMTKFYFHFVFTWEDVLLYQNRIYDAFILHYQHMISRGYK